jgi:plasmid stabilization system protein ParE
MEKEIIWTTIASKDFWSIVSYLKENWDAKVLDNFHRRLQLKISLIKAHPQIGFKSSKYSRFRQTLITRSYKLIYLQKKNYIVVLRLKHTSKR